MKKIRIFLLLILFSSCDFSSNLHNNIYLAQEQLSQHNYPEAVKLYKKILENVPNEDLRTKINFQVAEISSIYLRDFKDAAKYYEVVFNISREPLWQVKSLEKLADINFSYLKKYDDAYKYYSILMNFKPKLASFDLYEFRKAKSLTLNNKYKEALALFEEITKNSTHEYYVNAFYEMGIGYFYLEDWKKSISNFTEYIKREVDRNKIVSAKYMIANAYETDEQLKKAYTAYYSILNEYPNTDVIKQRLNSIYQRQIARKR